MDSMLALRPGLLQRAHATGVRSALLYSPGWLVEWLEGDEARVRAAWQASLEDLPVSHWLLLHRSSGAPTLGGPAQLASLHTGEKAINVARRLHVLVRENQEGWLAEPWEAWQALSAPCQLDAALPLADLARRDVLAIAADDHGSIDLVRHLALAHGSQVSYQRYAGSDLERRDVGAAYVDLAASDGITRVQALSRSALTHGVQLLGLRQMTQLVVLLGTSARRATSLLNQVRRFLRTREREVEVHVLSYLDGGHATAIEALAGVPGVQVRSVPAHPHQLPALAVVKELLGE
jgi:hypothetical protein